ncbi:MAG: hypothetical protein ACRCUM_01295, partial [Mycoplasmoidaceae bacterium]
IYEDDIAEIIKYYNNDLKDLDIDDIIELENYEDLRNDSFYYLTSDALAVYEKTHEKKRNNQKRKTGR